MQAELTDLGLAVEINLLGVNRDTSSSHNDEITAGRVLPWLQDTSEIDSWSLWHVVYRDVVILDQDGARVTAYNLTQHSLSTPANYAALKALLQDIAAE